MWMGFVTSRYILVLLVIYVFDAPKKGVENSITRSIYVSICIFLINEILNLRYLGAKLMNIIRKA